MLQVKHVLTFKYLARTQLGCGTSAWTGSATGTLETILSTSVEASPAILSCCVGIRPRDNLIYRSLVRTRARLSLHIFGFGRWSHHFYSELRHPRKGCHCIVPGFYSPPNYESGCATRSSSRSAITILVNNLKVRVPVLLKRRTDVNLQSYSDSCQNTGESGPTLECCDFPDYVRLRFSISHNFP